MVAGGSDDVKNVGDMCWALILPGGEESREGFVERAYLSWFLKDN